MPYFKDIFSSTNEPDDTYNGTPLKHGWVKPTILILII